MLPGQGEKPKGGTCHAALHRDRFASFPSVPRRRTSSLSSSSASWGTGHALCHPLPDGRLPPRPPSLHGRPARLPSWPRHGRASWLPSRRRLSQPFRPPSGRNGLLFWINAKVCGGNRSLLSGAAARPSLKIIHWMIFRALRPQRGFPPVPHPVTIYMPHDCGSQSHTRDITLPKLYNGKAMV